MFTQTVIPQSFRAHSWPISTFFEESDKMKKQIIILLAGVLMLIASGQVLAVSQYTIKDLGTLGGSYLIMPAASITAVRL